MLRKNLDDLDTNGQKGDWAFLKNDTRIAIRYGESAFKGMVIIPVSDTGSEVPPVWKWNGDKDSPTLSPSILVESVPNWNPGWHGYLTDGKLITV